MEVPELKYVDFELKDGIGMITMNNSEKLNALTMEGAQSLTKILNACSDSPEVRVIVIRGAQGNFCGGGDVKGMKYKVDNNCCETRPGLRCNNDVILSIVNNAKPVIAWLEGAVAGGGLSIALACDFSYAQLASKFVFAFVNIGFIPDMGSSLMLTKKLNAKIRSINSITSKVPHLKRKPNDESNMFCNSGHLLLKLLCSSILYIKLILD